MNNYLLAKVIILKSLRSGKLLVEYKAWLDIPYEVRIKAYEDMICPLCKNVGELTGSSSHMFGTEACCKDCDDFNFEGIREIRKVFPLKYEENA